MLFRRSTRRHRVEYAVHELASRRQGSFRQWRQRHQRHLRGDGSVLRDGAFPAIRNGAAGVEQLGLHQQPEIRRAGDESAPEFRSGRARQGAGRIARGLGRRCGVPLCRSRRGAARAEPEDQELRAAEEPAKPLTKEMTSPPPPWGERVVPRNAKRGGGSASRGPGPLISGISLRGNRTPHPPRTSSTAPSPTRGEGKRTSESEL